MLYALPKNCSPRRKNSNKQSDDNQSPYFIGNEKSNASPVMLIANVATVYSAPARDISFGSAHGFLRWF